MRANGFGRRQPRERHRGQSERGEPQTVAHHILLGMWSDGPRRLGASERGGREGRQNYAAPPGMCKAARGLCSAHFAQSLLHHSAGLYGAIDSPGRTHAVLTPMRVRTRSTGQPVNSASDAASRSRRAGSERM